MSKMHRVPIEATEKKRRPWNKFGKAEKLRKTLQNARPNRITTPSPTIAALNDDMF
jgi:Txe/YoeB family toxin of Txe-Axe toxin-antitoxin module